MIIKNVQNLFEKQNRSTLYKQQQVRVLIKQTFFWLIAYVCCINVSYNRQNHRFFIEFQQNNQMEKISWKQVRHSIRNSAIPNARWGHSCCVIQDEVIFFGGYADSTYMNDIWSFNTITMEWNEVQTTGRAPSPRSNCTLNYDKQNNRIIVFGGGGPNKVRYNSIYILDWKSKEWTELPPTQNQPAPWERTYHTAELFSHYLITFGGEGMADMDDLWIFDFQTLRWSQVQIPKTLPRPCARRFHSSAIVNNQFFVIAGCYAKYRCLSDIYSIDLTPFLQSGKVDCLFWRERKMKDYTFLTRWGHTSAVYQDKICVFGGRFCNDLNDILVIDPKKDVVTMLKVAGEAPKPRRRHSACFLGNSMLVFGGFNGEYYNDLHYISIKFPKKKLFIEENITLDSLQALKNIRSLEWQWIQTKNGEKYWICVGLLIQRFSSVQNFDSFLKEISGNYTKQQFQEVLLTFYRGYGKIDLTFSFKYGISIFQTKEQMQIFRKKSITQSQAQKFSLLKKSKQIEPVILVDQKSYCSYLQQKRMEQCYFDVTFNVNDEVYFRANKALLAINSKYFSNLFSQYNGSNNDIIKVAANDINIFQTLLNYLSSNFIVASSNATHAFWAGLIALAEYYCLQKLMKICQNELLAYVSEYSCEQLLSFAIQMNLKELATICSQLIIKRMVNSNRQGTVELLQEKQNEQISIKKEELLKQVYNEKRFDILQRKIDTQGDEEKNSLKKMQHIKNQSQQEEKQNNQIKN